jgi:alkanesulfonate monooxygenase SsuD/methylene tetrahydromethanopterin reductase-like flavin-dependent oxidoreductase (luciferase family)
MSEIRVGLYVGYPADAKGLDAIVQRIKMGCVFLVLLRHPIIASKTITSLDQASNGRLLLFPAIGGDYPREYENCGIGVRERAGRTDESLEIMRRLWAGERVSYEGRYYTLSDAVAQPLPVQPGGPPLWLAHRGRAEASLRRTAKLCDGWLASWVSADRFKTAWERTREHARQEGRDPASLTPAALVRMVVAGSKEEAALRAARWRTEMYGHPSEPTLMERLLPLGPPEECAQKVKDFIDAGVTHPTISCALPEDEWEEQLKIIVKEVLPRAGITLRRAPR